MHVFEYFAQKSVRACCVTHHTSVNLEIKDGLTEKGLYKVLIPIPVASAGGATCGRMSGEPKERAGLPTVKCHECLSAASSHGIGRQTVRAGSERS